MAEKVSTIAARQRRHALDFLEKQKGASVSDEQAMDLALEAQRWARKQRRRPRRGTK
jgi:hypothetical protein